LNKLRPGAAGFSVGDRAGKRLWWSIRIDPPLPLRRKA
jgi:hypothetical protein